MMGQRRMNLVQQMHEALRSTAPRSTRLDRDIEELCARIRRLHARDARFAAVKLSHQVEELRPVVLSA